MVRLKNQIKLQGKPAVTSPVLRLLIVLYFVIPGFQAMSQTVSSDEALTIAKKFYKYTLSQDKNLKSARKETFKVAESVTIIGDTLLKSASTIPAYHIINIGDNEGFMLIAGDKRVQPILAYSMNGNYIPGQVPDDIASFINGYRKEISDIIANDPLKNLSPDNGWAKLESIRTKSASVSDKFNLISTDWGQGKFYNDFCPEDPAIVGPAFNGRVPAGCVAIVMAQIMNYWSWPLMGTGSDCYIPSAHKEYGEQCADFGSTIYNFSTTADQLTDSNTDIARLIYHAAVSVQMNFAPTGSSAFSSTTAKAFRNNFRYSKKTEFVYRSDYTDSAWVALLKKNLDNGVPLYYRGDKDGSASHAFICDGYDQDDRFHFNWGWDGKYNGFFVLSAMNPANNFDYTSNQGAIINLFPANDDLLVDGLQADNTTVTKGGQISVSFNRVYNGPDFTGLNVSYSYWLSSDKSVDTGDILLGQDDTIMSSEDNRIATVKNFTLPDSLSDGDYYILILADSKAQVDEVNESNNLGILGITVQDTPATPDVKSSLAGSDDLEPNNSVNEAYFIGNETEYINKGLTLSEGDVDWFEFILNSKTYYAKIATGENSSHGFYGVKFSFNGGGVEILTFETIGTCDTKIWLFDNALKLVATNDNGGEFPYSKVSYRPFSSTTNLNNLFSEQNFRLYPNPVKGKVYIDSESRLDKNITVALLDMRGTLLEKKTLNEMTGEYSLDLSRYTNGEYIVKIYKSDGTFITRKIMKNG